MYHVYYMYIIYYIANLLLAVAVYVLAVTV